MLARNYEVRTEGDRLVFRTSSFKAEKRSVLPANVYSREFSSMLFASATATLAYMFGNIIETNIAVVRYLNTLLVFIAAFLGSHKYIFRESYLEAEFNRAAETLNIVRSGIIMKKPEKIPFADIRSINTEVKKFLPENVDGIKFVRKISLQHGSDIPGLGDVEEFFTLSLKLNDGAERVIFAGKDKKETETALKEIRCFLNIQEFPLHSQKGFQGLRRVMHNSRAKDKT